MNAEVRDHAIFLKGALDLITNSTTADTGTATYIRVSRAAAADPAYRAGVSGDSYYRFESHADGKFHWGPGNVTMDTRLRRISPAVLMLDAADPADGPARLDIMGTGSSVAFTVIQSGDTSGRGRFRIAGTGDISWGDGTSVNDVVVGRAAAGTLKTVHGFWAVDGLVTKTKAGAPTDADLVAGMQQNGAIILDTTNSRIYFRTAAATWKYAALS